MLYKHVGALHWTRSSVETVVVADTCARNTWYAPGSFNEQCLLYILTRGLGSEVSDGRMSVQCASVR
jgi:hypothetical protein